MINLHEYELIKEENGILRMVVVSVPCCPDCGDKMRVRDSRIRCFIKEDGQKCLLRHRRLRCAKCKKIHSELPDFIMPEKRYVADVILGLFFSDTSDQNQQICAVAENSTFYKWEIEITCRVWVFFLSQSKIEIKASGGWQACAKENISSADAHAAARTP